jgi:hypothetical protein
MRKLLIIILAAGFFTGISCKKKVDKKIENYIIEIMVDGKWYMYEYIEDGLDITYEFDGYEFQFYDNETVDAVVSTTKTKGTWKGDLNNLSITSNFPTATSPLNKLNNTWKIYDSYTNAVFAESTVGSVTSKMKLVKK